MKGVVFILFSFIIDFASCQNVNISNTAIFDGEPYLAIDPSNQQHLVAAWMGFQIGQNIVVKTSFSDDGGVNWSAPTWIPHSFSGNTSADVALQYDNLGNLYLSYIDFNNTDFSNGAIYVRKSIDGGNSWENAVEAISIDDCPDKLCVDRPWIVVDKSGGVNNGAVYVTSMNADQPSLISPPYNPYFAVSTNEGASFSTPRFIDSTNFIAGSTITQPMPSPTIGNDGVFYAAYPSYETSQSPFAHIYLASSENVGASFSYSNALTITSAGVSDPYAKKGSLLIADPSSSKHLAFFSLTEQNGDPDVYFIETFNGLTWTSLKRVNQDLIGNGKMQDLIWASFNERGDLAVAWRDRRNATSSGYQTETEIFAAIRFKDSTQFENDFALSNQQSGHNAVLEGNGNDFMNVQFIGDTLYAVWGDVRTGSLNIFFSKTNVKDATSSVTTIYSEKPLVIFPNPAKDFIVIDNFDQFSSHTLVDAGGERMTLIKEKKFSLANIPSGCYFVISEKGNKRFVSSLIIQ